MANNTILNPSRNRLDYGKILNYGDNYELDFAICATYSLDFDSLILASISLDLSEEFDTNLMDNPISLLKELRNTSDKIALFCESGQISCPANQRKVYILLEDMVFPVLTSKKFQNNRYASFHPKFWLIRYKKDENIRYRIIVSSRNLTFNRSWDISFTMDGKVNDNQTDKNDAIIVFLNYLMEHSNNHEKTNKIREILMELKYVHFDLDSDIFSDYDFILNGVEEDSYKIQNQPLFKEDGERLLIMTPFLSKQVISNFNKKINPNSNSILISQSNSLEKLKKDDCNNFKLYCLRDEIVVGESHFSEEGDDSLNQDIHAKIYVCEKNNFCELYLGSLNASCNALGGNIELMIKLTSKNLTVDKLSQDIFNNGKDNPFEEFTIKPYVLDDEDEEEDMAFIIKHIIRLNPKAKIIPNDDFYNIEVEFDDNPFNDLDIELRPLLSVNSQRFSKKIIFVNLNKLLLSEFFVINIDGLEKVIKVPTIGMPKDRQNEVISNIIKDEDAFIEYLSLLFGDDYYFNLIQSDVESDTKFNRLFNVQLSELYEKMLQASLYNPEKFDDIATIIESLSDKNIVPDGFDELYNAFLGVITK